MRIVGRRDVRRLLLIVRGQIGEESANEVNRVILIHRHEMRDAAPLRVGMRAAERFVGHILTRHGLNHIRPGDKHLRDAVHHHNEIGHRGGIDRATRARPGDDRDLRDDAGALDIAIEDVAVSLQPLDTLLNPCPCAIVNADHRDARRARHVHDLDDLLREHLTERAAIDREILREDTDRSRIKQAMSRNHPITERMALRHREVLGAVDSERIELAETVIVKQREDTFVRRSFAARMLLRLRLRLFMLALRP